MRPSGSVSPCSVSTHEREKVQWLPGKCQRNTSQRRKRPGGAPPATTHCGSGSTGHGGVLSAVLHPSTTPAETHYLAARVDRRAGQRYFHGRLEGGKPVPG